MSVQTIVLIIICICCAFHRKKQAEYEEQMKKDAEESRKAHAEVEVLATERSLLDDQSVVFSPDHLVEVLPSERTADHSLHVYERNLTEENEL